MTTYNLCDQPLLQFFNAGLPLSGGEVFFYNTGTTTKATVYQDTVGTVAPNPVTLNSNGYPTNGGAVIPIYFASGQAIKVVVAPSGAGDPPSSTLYTIDPAPAVTTIDFSNYFTATSSTVLTLNSGATLQTGVGSTLNLTTGTIKVLTFVDTSANNIITFPATGSAVNYISLTNAATGTNPSISTTGTDANIGLTLKGKGTGAIQLGQATSTDVRLVADQPIADSSGNKYISFTKTASAVNQVNVTNAATATAPTIASAGNDATVGLKIDTKGAATLSLGPTSANAIALGNSASPITANAAINNLTATLASAATVNIGAAASNVISITGTTTITAFDTIAAGAVRVLIFAGALTLTHNATSLILPGGASIVTVAGDSGIFVSLGSGNWRCIQYTTVNANPSFYTLQEVHSETGAVATGTTVIPADDTIPQSTEGDQYLSVTITPKLATSVLRIDVVAHVANSAATNNMMAALFQDATANALATGSMLSPAAGNFVELGFTHWMTSGTTSATTFKVRIGGSGAGTTTFNGSAGARFFGGTYASSITITEYIS